MIFKPAARYPADPRAVFVLALSVFSGLTALVLQVAPESLEALLPRWGLYVWGFTLMAGSAVALGGMAFQTVNGIIAEQIGNVMVAAATIFYSTVAFLIVGPSAIQAVGIVLAWGLACALRWIQLQVLINSAYSRQVKQQMLQKIYDEIEERRERERRHFR
jgi:hypothetical protein